MHRDHNARAQALENRDHRRMIKRHTPVHRGHHYIQPANGGILLFIGGVVQMAQMPDAKARHLEDKDRIALLLHSRKLGSDIGRDIAHQHFTQIKAMLDPFAKFLPPAAQDMGNRRIGKGGPMGVMGMVHRHHIGDQASRAEKPVKSVTMFKPPALRMRKLAWPT